MRTLMQNACSEMARTRPWESTSALVRLTVGGDKTKIEQLLCRYRCI